MGSKVGAVSFLQITAPELNDRVLADLLDTDSSIFVSVHIRSMDQNEAIKTVKRKITDLDSMKIELRSGRRREGFEYGHQCDSFLNKAFVVEGQNQALTKERKFQMLGELTIQEVE